MNTESANAERPLKGAFFGYSKKNVNEIVSGLREKQKRLDDENTQLRSKIGEMQARLDQFDELKSSVTTILLAAKATAERIVNEAENKRQLLLIETERKKAQILSQTQTKSNAILQDANAKREQMLSAAEKKVYEQELHLQREKAEFENAMHWGQAEVAKLVEARRRACEEELRLLEQLLHMQAAPSLRMNAKMNISAAGSAPDSGAGATDAGAAQEAHKPSIEEHELFIPAVSGGHAAREDDQDSAELVNSVKYTDDEHKQLPGKSEDRLDGIINCRRFKIG